MTATDPFIAAKDELPTSKLSASLGTLGHKQSLSVLIRNTDLGDANQLNPSIELPSAPALSHELFAGQDFDPSEFLLSRKHTTLDDLRSELRAYLATLRSSLVAVINEEYEAFIGLSTGLRDASVSASLATIKRPILAIRNEVSRIKEELEAMKDEMESLLTDRKEVREAKARLRRLLEMEEGVEKVEGLLKIGDGNVQGRDTMDITSVVESPAKRLERIVGEYNQMLYLVAKAGDLPFVRSLDPRIARITSTLQLDLSQLLTSVIKTAPNTDQKTTRDSLSSIFRSYASLGLHDAAEDIVRRILVRPFVLKTIHRDVLTSVQSPTVPATPVADSAVFSSFSDGETSQNGLKPAINITTEEPHLFHYNLEPVRLPRGSDDALSADVEPLVNLYNKLLNFITKDLSLVLDVSEKTTAPPPPTSGLLSSAVKVPIPVDGQKRANYDLLTNVLWDEIANRLMIELGGTIYAAGRPAVFHQNYTLTSIFISRIESLASSIPHLNTLRSHSSYVNFLKRFQLPVYFQLRFKEIVGAVERTLEGTSSIGGGNVFLLAESDAIWKALQQCWNDDVYLPELAPRFWRLTLQLLSRYRTWLNNVAPKHNPPNKLPSSSSNANLSALAAGTPSSSRNSFDGGRPSLSAGSAGNTRPGTPSDEISEEATLRQLTVLISDSLLMTKKATELYEEKIQGKLLGEEEVQDETSPIVVLRESANLVSSLVPSLSNQVIAILTKRCAEHLKHVRPVVNQIRASTRKGPSEPSFFVFNIFKELRGYTTGSGKVVDVEMRTDWLTAVLEEIMSRYAVILTDTKKTQAGLRWLKKGRQGLSFFGRGTAPAEDGSEEEDKVKLQMLLDIDTLVNEASTIGVSIEGSHAYEALRKSVVEEEGKSDAERK
ncbi:COG complex component [Meredithblackwellia eburnea MCA 4105]